MITREPKSPASTSKTVHRKPIHAERETKEKINAEYHDHDLVLTVPRTYVLTHVLHFAFVSSSSFSSSIPLSLSLALFVRTPRLLVGQNSPHDTLTCPLPPFLPSSPGTLHNTRTDKKDRYYYPLRNGVSAFLLWSPRPLAGGRRPARKVLTPKAEGGMGEN